MGRACRHKGPRVHSEGVLSVYLTVLLNCAEKKASQSWRSWVGPRCHGGLCFSTGGVMGFHGLAAQPDCCRVLKMLSVCAEAELFLPLRVDRSAAAPRLKCERAVLSCSPLTACSLFSLLFPHCCPASSSLAVRPPLPLYFGERSDGFKRPSSR